MNAKLNDTFGRHLTWQRFEKVGDRQTLGHENDCNQIVAGATLRLGN